MKQLILTAVVALLCLSANAQTTYKSSFSNGKLHIVNVNSVTIKGYSGSEVIISADIEASEKEVNERAKGLREINASGSTDNTNIGLSATKSNNELVIEQISANNDTRYTIQVPNSVNIYMEHSKLNGKKIMLMNISSEIEVDANYNNIEFENLSGSVALNTVYGSIDGTFESISKDKSISLYSVYGHVDVAVPASAKVDFRVKAPFGKMFTDLELEMPKEDQTDDLEGVKMTGSLNGGGANVSIKASYDNIYIRKKK